MTEIRHIAIIMDGNRRYAEKNNLPAGKGHDKGAEKVKEALKWCREIGVKELTLYTFSVQNFNRSEDEKHYLFNLLNKHFDRLKDDKELYENKIRIRVIGKKELFPKDVRKRLEEIEERTKHHDKFLLNFAMAYGGREEIVDACRKIAKDVKESKINVDDIDEELINKSMYLSSKPDLVIRTGGDYRTSNFLTWQTPYSEWFFPETLWPEFSKEDFMEIIGQFKSRERRFGV